MSKQTFEIVWPTLSVADIIMIHHHLAVRAAQLESDLESAENSPVTASHAVYLIRKQSTECNELVAKIEGFIKSIGTTTLDDLRSVLNE